MSRKLLGLLDNSIVNFTLLTTLFYVIYYNYKFGLIFTVFYIFLMTERRKSYSRELIGKRMSNMEITTDKKLQSLMSVLKNDKIDFRDKEIVVMQILPEDLPINKKLEIVCLYLGQTEDKEKLLKKLLNDKNMPQDLAIELGKNPDYRGPILACIAKSSLDDKIKNGIIDALS